jgi:hypothetical protein
VQASNWPNGGIAAHNLSRALWLRREGIQYHGHALFLREIDAIMPAGLRLQHSASVADSCHEAVLLDRRVDTVNESDSSNS